MSLQTYAIYVIDTSFFKKILKSFTFFCRTLTLFTILYITGTESDCTSRQTNDTYGVRVTKSDSTLTESHEK